MWTDDEDWRDQALCFGLDPDLFFPIGTSGPAVQQIAEAKKVCAQCPVRAECLEYAIEHKQIHGIWGGLDEEERLELRRQAIRQRSSA